MEGIGDTQIGRIIYRHFPSLRVFCGSFSSHVVDYAFQSERERALFIVGE
jgi:hypothetical protein